MAVALHQSKISLVQNRFSVDEGFVWEKKQTKAFIFINLLRTPITSLPTQLRGTLMDTLCILGPIVDRVYFYSRTYQEGT